MPRRFIVLEDHPLVLNALATHLRNHFGEQCIAYEGSSVTAAATVLSQEGADCVLLDLDLGDNVPPIRNVALLSTHQVPIIIVSAATDRAMVNASLLAGAAAYVAKQEQPEAIINAIETVLRGESYMSPDIASILLSEAPGRVNLAPQERRAMALYASGLTMKSVAQQLGVAETTAQEYIKRVRAKFSDAGTPLPTKTDMHQAARREGLIP